MYWHLSTQVIYSMENSFITKYHFAVLYFFYSPNNKTDFWAQNSQRGQTQIWLKLSQYLSIFVLSAGFQGYEVCHLKKVARDSAQYIIHQLDIPGAA